MNIDLTQKKELDREVENVEIINKELENSYFCVPPYASVRTVWLSEIVHMIENKDNEQFLKLCRTKGVTAEAKYRVTALIIDSERRAAQIVNRYKKLPIFSDFSEVIDYATVAFLEGNEICSRITLMPVIEGLFERWYDELNSKSEAFKTVKGKKRKGIKSVLNGMIDDLIINEANSTAFIKIRVISCLKFLKIAVNQFYGNGVAQKSFNRNISLHSMWPVKHMDRLLDNCRLFLLIDIIAESYLRLNEKSYPDLMSAYDVTNEEMKKYRKFYVKCASDGLNNSTFNRLKNDFWTINK